MSSYFNVFFIYFIFYPGWESRSGVWAPCDWLSCESANDVNKHLWTKYIFKLSGCLLSVRSPRLMVPKCYSCLLFLQEESDPCEHFYFLGLLCKKVQA